MDSYRVSRLPNGLTVATAPMPHMSSVSLGLWVSIGGRHEPEHLNGISHFIEHMLFKGTRRRSAQEISQAVEGVGGYLNAFTGEESTCFYAKARHDRLPVLLEVLADMFRHSTFRAPEIRKERSVIKEEVAMYLDQPQQQVQELLNETLWPGHPLGRPLTGTVKSLDKIQRTDLLSYLKRNYHAGATMLVAAGNVRHEVLKSHASRLLRTLPGGAKPQGPPVRDEQGAARVRLLSKDTAQTQLALGIRTCSRHDERRFALRMLNVLLAENMSSRLFQLLREELGLVYSIHSALSFYDDTGALVISAGLDAEDLPRALELVGRELRRLRQRPPSAREMRQAKDYLLGQVDLSLENSESRMMWLGEQIIGYGRVITPAAIKRRLLRVTAAQIQSVAEAFFKPERVSLAVVSARKSTRGLAGALRM